MSPLELLMILNQGWQVGSGRFQEGRMITFSAFASRDMSSWLWGSGGPWAGMPFLLALFLFLLVLLELIQDLLLLLLLLLLLCPSFSPFSSLLLLLLLLLLISPFFSFSFSGLGWIVTVSRSRRAFGGKAKSKKKDRKIERKIESKAKQSENYESGMKEVNSVRSQGQREEVCFSLMLHSSHILCPHSLISVDIGQSFCLLLNVK